MAKQIIVRLVDDLDQAEGRDTDADETVRFAIDGTQYEIDLSEVHAGELRKLLAPYVEAGSRVLAGNGRPAKFGRDYHSGTRTSSSRPTAVDQDQNKAMRTWWAANWQTAGLPAPKSNRGQLPAQVKNAYHKHQGRPVPAAVEPAKAPAAKSTAPRAAKSAPTVGVAFSDGKSADTSDGTKVSPRKTATTSSTPAASGATPAKAAGRVAAKKTAVKVSAEE